MVGVASAGWGAELWFWPPLICVACPRACRVRTGAGGREDRCGRAKGEVNGINLTKGDLTQWPRESSDLLAIDFIGASTFSSATTTPVRAPNVSPTTSHWWATSH